ARTSPEGAPLRIKTSNFCVLARSCFVAVVSHVCGALSRGFGTTLRVIRKSRFRPSRSPHPRTAESHRLAPAVSGCDERGKKGLPEELRSDGDTPKLAQQIGAPILVG